MVLVVLSAVNRNEWAFFALLAVEVLPKKKGAGLLVSRVEPVELPNA